MDDASPIDPDDHGAGQTNTTITPVDGPGLYQYQYPHPAVTVDAVVFGLDEGELKLLLIERGLEPYAGCWALPGGFIKMDEDLEASALRELEEETGVRDVYFEQLGTYGNVGRDPRERVISVAYVALANLYDHNVKADTDANEAAWFELSDLPELAFDHAQIVADGIARLRAKVRYQPIGFELLPAKFTLSMLQAMYAKILDRELDKRNFRKKILAMDILEDTNEVETDVAHRAARLYRFDHEKYQRRVATGFNFEV